MRKHKNKTASPNFLTSMLARSPIRMARCTVIVNCEIRSYFYQFAQKKYPCREMSLHQWRSQIASKGAIICILGGLRDVKLLEADK